MDPGNVTTKISGIETREPAFNLPALWIPDSQREEAMLAGYTVVDPATVIATHLTEVFKRQLADFLDRQGVQGLLDTVAKHGPIHYVAGRAAKQHGQTGLCLVHIHGAGVHLGAGGFHLCTCALPVEFGNIALFVAGGINLEGFFTRFQGASGRIKLHE